MDRNKRNHVTIAFIVVVVLVVLWMLSGSMRISSRITLPGEKPDEEADGSQPLTEQALKAVEIRPDTVQAAVKTLDRPEAYSQVIQIQQFWDGGKGKFTVEVAVRDGWSRMDREVPGQPSRHSLTDGRSTYIWYGQEHRVYQGVTGTVSADDEQSIPTYEDILHLPAEQIAKAEFTVVGEGAVPCIYLETQIDEHEIVDRYWVSTDHGLLVAAETLSGGKTIYRMSGLSVELKSPDSAYFTLPNGKTLI